MEALVWFIAALVLAACELAAGEFTLLMLAGGAACAAIAAQLGAPTLASVAVFALASAGLIVFLRPVLRRRMQAPLVLDTSPAALVGAKASVLERVDGTGGQVRLDGTVWSARSMIDGHSFEVGEQVPVVHIDGSTAVIWKES
ncbi:NfeD family protein [Corynebacterium uberis]|uniref:NfeD family protein n=1 Tax=Corynebacterium TaxID=1716 RepID=UPI001D0BB5B3|nr:NfeD family protein [Corynebacterium uberis]MCZ9308637.1 NfeD family protein [Corynebacterium sp. c6VSa_13]UDL74279.1 NfeD family protein [Corynebacterium uberis]UDL74841.1 NfeD family protein [Corynebacterium uberis]UDL77055.1 NfeD family protein [Corynebacterium uberis]UDL79338.1 NfeD family protein [Corynebacterium uberis]